MTEIKKILIANRGEIACRVIRTARKMGIATVAVYSDADRKALHVRMADEAVHIGPSPAVESYLVIEKVIAAAKETGADAIHPGYGFLSENPDFVRACEAAGITFIGPSAEAMEAMGLKDAAKALMDKAGVPITPGYHGADQSPDLLKNKAGEIGYPVLIKAVAGGGGKGMRKVERAADFDAALASCKREAASSFGNDDVLIEKYIQSPRHIEIQVFGDMHGNIVHMFERDCSLQRRHQKVIEEAPAPGMTQAVRKAMTDAAIAAAKAVNYVGAGTVEFIVDGSGELRTDGFWFMEMNTRLQVEHPVTEEITGLDLVEWQIRVARGEELPAQDEITMTGHAVEARLYAEDPINDFLPTHGLIRCLDYDSAQNSSGRFRIDTGYEAQDRFGIHYDPMIAKIIGIGEDRETAIENCWEGVEAIEVWPLKTNGAFLLNVLENEDFKACRLNTHFIPSRMDDLRPLDLIEYDQVFGLAALELFFAAKHAAQTPFEPGEAWRLNALPSHHYLFQRNGEAIRVDVNTVEDNFAKLSINGQTFFYDFGRSPNSPHVQGFLTHFYDWDTKIKEDYVSLHWIGNFVQIPFYDPSDDTVTASPDTLTAPMPGKVIALNVAAGDTVKSGDPLIILEAMKMEQTLTAPRDGVVAEIGAGVGDLVSDGALLVRLQKEET